MENPTRYPGQLDPDFSQHPQAPGWVDLLRALNWAPVMDLFFSSAAPTPDGSLYVCGYFAQNTDVAVEYFVIRLHNDASLDTHFGEQGIVRGTFPINFKAIMPTRLILQDDGKLLMQSLAYSNAGGPDPLSFVLRLLDSGEPDTTFANQGLMRLELPVGRYNALLAEFGDLHVLPDGRILGCHSGVSYLTTPNPKNSGLVYRLTADGRPDSSFNGNGLLDLSVDGASLHITRCISGPDLTTFVVGQISDSTSPYCRGLVARLNAQGQPDPTFGANGIQDLPLNGHHLSLQAIARQPDGALLVVGIARHPLDNVEDQGVLIGLSADGLLDRRFNRGQPLFTPINERYNVEWLDVQALDDGKWLVAGRSWPKVSGFDTYLYLARYLPDGTADAAFGNSGNGRVETHTGGNTTTPFEMTRQADGKVLVGLNAGGFRKGTLLRYLP